MPPSEGRRQREKGLWSLAPHGQDTGGSPRCTQHPSHVGSRRPCAKPEGKLRPLPWLPRPSVPGPQMTPLLGPSLLPRTAGPPSSVSFSPDGAQASPIRKTFPSILPSPKATEVPSLLPGGTQPAAKLGITGQFYSFQGLSSLCFQMSYLWL